MSERTFGSLNAGDVTAEVRVNDAGFNIAGKIQWVWHRVNHKGEPMTALMLDINGGDVKLTRPAFTEIEFIDYTPPADEGDPA